MQLAKGFGLNPFQKGTQQLNPGGGQPPCRFEMDLRREHLEITLEKGDRRSEGCIAGVAADLGDCAQDPDCPQLLKYVRIAQDNCLGGRRSIVRLMGANGFKHRRNFGTGEVGILKNGGSLVDGVSDMIPASQELRFLRPMADEDPEVVEVGCCEDDIVVIDQAFADQASQGVEPRLVAELIRRAGLFAEKRIKVCPVSD